MLNVCIYLRKSRADIEREQQGEGETLSRHRSILLKFAKEQELNIVKIHEEIVSGESIVHRPEMLELLKEVKDKKYDGVLCMDMDRLGRGNMQEQGMILEAFKNSNTKIITPRKTYDLHDEFDEEYSEFEAFMARKELKIINRRLQRGRVRSIEEGNYIATNPPYGYLIEYKDNHRIRTLKIDEEQAHVVRLIFDLYANRGLGSGKIANHLNELGYKSYTGINWTSASVLNTIKNVVYTGKVVWKKKKYKKSTKPDQVKEVKQNKKSQWIIAEGKHEGIISEELFDKAQRILKSKYHVPYATKVTNPLSGLIICNKCGASMVYRPYSKGSSHIVCYNKCGNKSSRFDYVEKRLLDSLDDLINQYVRIMDDIKVESQQVDNNTLAYEKALKNGQEKLVQLHKQKENLHDLLERGIYDVDTYLSRSALIAKRIEKLEESMTKIEKQIQSEKLRVQAKEEIIPAIKTVLRLYHTSNDPEEKNQMLKSILEKAVYNKEKDQKNDDFELVVYPRI